MEQFWFWQVISVIVITCNSALNIVEQNLLQTIVVQILVPTKLISSFLKVCETMKSLLIIGKLSKMVNIGCIL